MLSEAGTEHVELSTDRDWLIDVARFIRRRRSAGPVNRATRFDGRYRGAAPAPAPAAPVPAPPAPASAAPVPAPAAAMVGTPSPGGHRP